MRRKNEIIMASVSFQTCGPTGFASCWKQAPMTLEDAHGKLLPLPLELVVSWEMFDSILLSHFRKLAGEKKVEKREYEIEDGSTRGTLARTTSWSQICKPGRKIEMSMIFKEANKTGVACPKCDTISNEKKGVQVECSNPDCKMIFRTEDDENGVYADEESRQKRHLSMLGRVATMSSSPTEQERAFDDKPDDLPGMFKRVIIRLLSVKEPSSDSKLQDRMDLKSQEFTPRFRALVQWYQENGVLWIPNQKTGVSSSVESQNRVTATPAAFDEWYMEIDEPYLPKNWKGISDVDNSMKARPLPNLPGSHFEYDSVHMSNIVSPLGQPLDILPMDLFDSIFWGKCWLFHKAESNNPQIWIQ
ncbi:hypothetical protein N431DRAFT_413880 [Stipitochalara longipes BDJ]|nr:hypothetical protein N431DRAFT_413880 [Stipitochalara longipes BDJ]